MKTILLAVLLLAVPAMAQPAASTEIQPDGRVTFRLQAPEAKQVQLNCEGLPGTNMLRNAEGVWTYTTPPLAPDLYAYSFEVDGVHVLDTSNPLLKYNLLNPESLLHVRGPHSLLWEINDVPHGQLHRQTYQSRVAKGSRNYLVYTPPDYDPKAKTRYPVLYLLHGYSDDATTWTTAGRANVIMDNLIARGQAKPMVVVMPLGYGTMDIVNTNWSREKDPVSWTRNLEKFNYILLDEVMPQVERSYRVSKDREFHAVAGLSMGGTESLVTGLNHLSQFAWVGSFSAGGLDTNSAAQFPNLTRQANDQLRLLWIACGRDDKRLENNQAFCHWLAEKNIHYTWVETPGDHNYLVWRRNLCAFAPLLFQDRK